MWWQTLFCAWTKTELIPDSRQGTESPLELGSCFHSGAFGVHVWARGGDEDGDPLNNQRNYSPVPHRRLQNGHVVDAGGEGSRLSLADGITALFGAPLCENQRCYRTRARALVQHTVRTVGVSYPRPLVSSQEYSP